MCKVYINTFFYSEMFYENVFKQFKRRKKTTKCELIHGTVSVSIFSFLVKL